MKILCTKRLVINLTSIRFIETHMGKMCGITVHFDKERSVFMKGNPNSLLMGKLTWAMSSEENNIYIDEDDMRKEEEDLEEEHAMEIANALRRFDA